MKKSVALISFFTAFIAFSAQAAEGPAGSKEPRHPQGPHHAACQGDVQKFCAGVQPGEGRIVRCLKEHRKDLSEQCRKATERRRPAEGEGKNK